MFAFLSFHQKEWLIVVVFVNMLRGEFICIKNNGHGFLYSTMGLGQAKANKAQSPFDDMSF